MGYAVDAIFCAVVLILLAVFVLYLSGVKPYVAMSGSMEPAIHTGSVCFVDTKASYEDVSVNDIIAYETSSGTLVTHRVVAITEDGLETKGDANDVSDGITTTPENFFGMTLFAVPGIGFAIVWLRQPSHIAAVAIAAVILVAMTVVYGIVTRKDPEELEAQDRG